MLSKTSPPMDCLLRDAPTTATRSGRKNRRERGLGRLLLRRGDHVEEALGEVELEVAADDPAEVAVRVVLEPELADEVQHPDVVGQDVAGEGADAGSAAAWATCADERRPDPAALLGVLDERGELRVVALVGVALVARDADDPFAVAAAAGGHDRRTAGPGRGR